MRQKINAGHTVPVNGTFVQLKCTGTHTHTAVCDKLIGMKVHSRQLYGQYLAFFYFCSTHFLTDFDIHRSDEQRDELRAIRVQCMRSTCQTCNGSPRQSGKNELHVCGCILIVISASSSSLCLSFGFFVASFEFHPGIDATFTRHHSIWSTFGHFERLCYQTTWIYFKFRKFYLTHRHRLCASMRQRDW